MKKRYCKCGCGKIVTSKRTTYCYGHKKLLDQKLGIRLCECGCGEFAKLGYRFMHGHNRKGQSWVDGQYEKLIASRAWYRHSDEVKQRIGDLSRGRTYTDKTKEKHSKAMLGNQHSIGSAESKDYGKLGKWGIMHPYVPGYKFRRIRSIVYERDEHACIVCGCDVAGTVGTKINIHHVVPVAIGYKSVLCDAESNLVTLCVTCHTFVHTEGYNKKNERGRWKSFLPVAYEHLRQFRYRELLLTKYIERESK